MFSDKTSLPSSFVSISGPMMILDEPRSDNINFIALAQCKLRRGVRGVTMLEEMRFSIVYKNWNNLELIPGALMEVRGNLHIRGDRDRMIKTKEIRVALPGSYAAKNMFPNLCNKCSNSTEPVQALLWIVGQIENHTLDSAARSYGAWTVNIRLSPDNNRSLDGSCCQAGPTKSCGHFTLLPEGTLLWKKSQRLFENDP
ncbi:hypothetical protein V8E54_004758 [Elaphomyces granulatus]